MRRLIASWFGTGLILGELRGSDTGSGTVGSVFALLPALALGRIGWWAQLSAALLVAIGSVWASRPYARDDPGWIVIDEAAGTFLAVVGLSIWPALVAFAVFRLADISKRLPGVAWADNLGGPLGVTLDDLVAGSWGLAAGWIVSIAVG